MSLANASAGCASVEILMALNREMKYYSGKCGKCDNCKNLEKMIKEAEQS